MTIRYLKHFLFAAALYSGNISIYGQSAPLHQFTSTNQAFVQKEDAGLVNMPPPILVRDKPSALVWIDGDPVITVDTMLRMYRILNTPYLIIKNHNDNKYYLYGKGIWYVSDSATTGYVYRRTVPPVIRLMDSLVRRGKPVVHRKTASRPVQPPEVVITQEPAILLYTDGKPEWKNITGTGLAYVRNTPGNIFKDTASGQVYVLASGRWYRSTGALQGPWEYLPAGQLPPDFARIPGTCSRADVLIHVKGTPAAIQAVAQTAELRVRQVKRGIDSSVSVVYDGGAEFASLPGSELFVAQNSDLPVFSFRDDYYALKNATWYKSRFINGPWEVSTQVPPGIDQLPVSNPFYYARFVHVIDTTDAQVETGFTGGYLHTFIQDNVIVFGTGNIYPQWCRQKFLPRPLTWLQGLHYKTDKGWENQPPLSYYHFDLP